MSRISKMPSGGARPGTGPKGPRVPRMGLRQTIEAMKEGLDHKPAVVSVTVGRAALAHLEKMREQEAALFRLKDVEQQYHEYLRSWEPLWEAARAHGIEVYQPMGSDQWHWRRGENTGTAPTPSEALLQALT